MSRPVRVKFCERGDVFVWVNGEQAWSPFLAEEFLAQCERQKGTFGNFASLAEVTSMVMTCTAGDAFFEVIHRVDYIKVDYIKQLIAADGAILKSWRPTAK